jgi:hypothetical protein
MCFKKVYLCYANSDIKIAKIYVQAYSTVSLNSTSYLITKKTHFLLVRFLFGSESRSTGSESGPDSESYVPRVWYPTVLRTQCCGSWIQCLFDLWIRDPGWVKN